MEIFENNIISVHSIAVGGIGTNCYFVCNKETKKCVIIDPGAHPDKISSYMESNGMIPEKIFLTHGHFDHMMAAGELKQKYQIKVCMLDKEEELAANPELNCSLLFMRRCESIQADETVCDGQIIDFVGARVKVISTPGHTAGGCCYLLENEKLLFSGDTLFDNSTGRCDLPTGSDAAMSRSLEKLFKLEGGIQVFPGHGGFTTIARERDGGYSLW